VLTLRIGIDVDDVLFETTTAWLKRHNEITGDDVTTEDVKSWDIAQYIKKGNRDTLFYILHQSDFWKTVDPIDDAVEYLWKLINEHDDIETYIVTATYPDTAAAKMRRFFQHFPFVDDRRMVLTASKEIINVDLILDDNPENLCAMPSGCAKLLFDRPHNRWCDESGIGAIRVHNWEEAYKFITTIAWLESEDEIEA